jgi:hypothetical protein
MTVVLKNATREPLLFSTYPLSAGEWDVSPLGLGCAPGSLTAWTSQSDGVWTGTQGEVNLVVQSDPSSIVTISWDNPFYGGNSFSGTAPPPYKLSYQGGGGDNAVVVFTLTK